MIGEFLVVSPNTFAGMKLLEIQGKDQHREISGEIIAFGSFPQWRLSFDAVFPTESEVQVLLNSLIVKRNQ